MRQIRLSTDSPSDIAHQLCSVALERNETACVIISDKWGREQGRVMVTRESDGAYTATGSIARRGGSRDGVEFSIEYEHGIVPEIATNALPEPSTPAAFHAAGCNWTRENAPVIDYRKQAMRPAERKLVQRAQEAFKAWAGAKDFGAAL